MIRKFAAVLLAAFTAVPAVPQEVADYAVTFPKVYNYDLDSTTYIGCEYQGAGARMGGPDYTVTRGGVQTTGSSVTIDATDGATDPFNEVNVGDLLIFSAAGFQGARRERYVVTKAGADQITVDTAITLPASTMFSYRRLACGATLGWVPTKGFSAVNFQLQIRQQNTTSGIDYQVQGKMEGIGQNNVPISAEITKTSTYDGWEYVTYRADFVRIAFKLDTTDDGSDTGADAEKIDIVAHLVK